MGLFEDGTCEFARFHPCEGPHPGPLPGGEGELALFFWVVEALVMEEIWLPLVPHYRGGKFLDESRQ